MRCSKYLICLLNNPLSNCFSNCISRKTVDTEYTYYLWCMTSTDIVKWRKNEWLWKFWKRNDLYENFENRGVVEKREGGGGNEIHAPCACGLSVTVLFTYITRNSIQAGFACRQTFRSSNVIFLFVFVCVSVFMNYKVSGVGI